QAAALVKKLSGKEPQRTASLGDFLAIKDLDAAIVATPDHAHSRNLVELLAAKKHVYLEKPFGNRLDEANEALDAARKSDRAVTLGTQRRSDPRYVAAAALMKSGMLGPVVQAEVVQNAHSPYRWRNAAYAKAVKEADTDWKAWQAGRSDVAFDPKRYAEFRLYRDYSTGIIDQWMTHLIDTVHLLTGAAYPRSVSANGGCYAWKDGRENGDTLSAALDYGSFLATYSCSLANGAGARAQVLCRDGTLEYETAWRVSGAGVRGSKVAAKTVEPASKGDMDSLHMADWLACARKGSKETACTAEHGHQHAVACIMADLALRSGKRQKYDEKTRAVSEA
ncbi:MAG: Gfo/Idh/MocA family oxidoreductase, partial [Gemmataceae bacterium]|nr:Gfo/Idh/MocA family oxidoreductase [Gemmataceae bacterium]